VESNNHLIQLLAALSLEPRQKNVEHSDRKEALKPKKEPLVTNEIQPTSIINKPRQGERKSQRLRVQGQGYSSGNPLSISDSDSEKELSSVAPPKIKALYKGPSMSCGRSTRTAKRSPVTVRKSCGKIPLSFRHNLVSRNQLQSASAEPQQSAVVVKMEHDSKDPSLLNAAVMTICMADQERLMMNELCEVFLDSTAGDLDDYNHNTWFLMTPEWTEENNVGRNRVMGVAQFLRIISAGIEGGRKAMIHRIAMAPPDTNRELGIVSWNHRRYQPGTVAPTDARGEQLAAVILMSSVCRVWTSLTDADDYNSTVWLTRDLDKTDLVPPHMVTELKEVLPILSRNTKPLPGKDTELSNLYRVLAYLRKVARKHNWQITVGEHQPGQSRTSAIDVEAAEAADDLDAHLLLSPETLIPSVGAGGHHGQSLNEQIVRSILESMQPMMKEAKACWDEKPERKEGHEHRPLEHYKSGWILFADEAWMWPIHASSYRSPMEYTSHQDQGQTSAPRRSDE
jgi:hypothetical protein